MYKSILKAQNNRNIIVLLYIHKYVRHDKGVDKMVCYIIPTIAAIVHGISRKKIKLLGNDETQKHLFLLLTGGAIFGFIDHLWNGELFISKNLGKDLLLGVTITIIIFLVWGIIVFAEKAKQSQATEEKIIKDTEK